MIRTILIAWLLLIPGLAFTAETDPSPFDFSTFNGKIEFFQALAVRHGNISANNLQFHRSFLTALNHFLETHKNLGEAARPLWQDEVERISAKYSDVPVAYDEAALKELRSGLVKDVDVLAETPAFDLFLTAQAQLARIRQNPDANVVKENLAAWLRLAPFLYEADGTALKIKSVEKVRVILRALSANQLDNAYGDMWKHHLAELLVSTGKRLNDTQLLSAINLHTREFLQIKLQPAVTPKVVAGAVGEVRTLSLEEVPLAVALFRGYFGADCSILSVPDYVALKEVRVFLIRKSGSFGARPDGYILSVDVTVNGKSLPYVLTVNGGALSTVDVAASLRMLAQLANTEELIVPDHASVPALVNTTAAALGMTSKSPVPVTVKFPAGWEIVSKGREVTGYSDYYGDGKLLSAIKTSVYDLPVKTMSNVIRTQASNPYIKGVSADQIALKDRAILGANLVSGKVTMDEREEIRAKLHLTKDQLAATEPLTSSDGLTLAQFRRLQNELGYTLQDIAKFSSAVRIRSLSNIGKESPEIASSAQWRDLMTSASKALDKDGLPAFDQDLWGVLTGYMELKRLVPSDLRVFPEAVVQKILGNKRFDESAAAVSVVFQFIGYTAYPVHERIIAYIENPKAAEESKAGTLFYQVAAALFKNENGEIAQREEYLRLLENRILNMMSEGIELAEFHGQEEQRLLSVTVSYALKNPAFAKRLTELRMALPAMQGQYFDSLALIGLVMQNESLDPRLVPYLQTQHQAIAQYAFHNSPSGRLFKTVAFLKSSPNPQIRRLHARTLVKIRDRVLKGYSPDIEHFPALARDFPEMMSSVKVKRKLSEMFHVYSSGTSKMDAFQLAEALLILGVRIPEMKPVIELYIGGIEYPGYSKEPNLRLAKRAEQAMERFNKPELDPTYRCQTELID